jgi:hypothetical protein
VVLISVSLSRPQSHSTVGKFRSIEKSKDFIGNRSYDLLLPEDLFIYLYLRLHTLWIITEYEVLPRCLSVETEENQ